MRPARNATTHHVLLFMILVGTVGFASELQAQALPDSVYTSTEFQLGDGQPGDAVHPAGTPGTASIAPSEQRLGPDWADLFDGQGARLLEYADPSSNQWAVFIADDVSFGLEVDTTALVDGMVQNDTVTPQNDLGNAYVYSTLLNGNLVLFAGVERLVASADDLEFEFNQARVRLGRGGYGRGEPWEIVGGRTAGDVRVTVSFGVGGLASFAVQRWESDETWTPVGSVSGEGCNGDETMCVVCNNGEIPGGPWSVLGVASEQFVEFGLNVDLVLGLRPDFETIQLRTSEDIAFGYFADGN